MGAPNEKSQEVEEAQPPLPGSFYEADSERREQEVARDREAISDLSNFFICEQTKSGSWTLGAGV